MMKLKSSEELVKYMTERAVGFISTPRDERKKQKMKADWRTQWFGLLPMSLHIWRRRRK